MITNLPEESTQGSDDPTGRIQAVTFALPEGAIVDREYALGSIQGRARTLTSRAIPRGPIRIWIDPLLPITAVPFDPDCGQWVLDDPALLVTDVQSVAVSAHPTCDLQTEDDSSKRPPGLLLLQGDVENADHVLLIHNDDLPTAFQCLDSVTLEADDTGMADVVLEDLVVAPPCAGTLIFETNSPDRVPYGTHTVTFATRDGWDRGTTCHTVAHVPSPPPEPEPEPAPPVESAPQPVEITTPIPEADSGCSPTRRPVGTGSLAVLLCWYGYCTYRRRRHRHGY